MSYIELLYPGNEASSGSWAGTGYPNSSYHTTNVHGRTHLSSGVVKLHVSLCCEKCVQKVRKSLRDVDDIESVDVDMHKERVIVRGHANPETVLRKVRTVKKSAQLWDRSHEYGNYNQSTGAYDYYGPRPSFSGYDYPSAPPAPSSFYDYDQNHRRAFPQASPQVYDYDYFRSHDYPLHNGLDFNHDLLDVYQH